MNGRRWGALLLRALMVAALVGPVGLAQAGDDAPLGALKAQMWAEGRAALPPMGAARANAAAAPEVAAPDGTAWANPVQGWSRIAFYGYRDGNAEIYTVGGDGQNLRRLTFDPAADTAPRINPDYTHIAFQSKRSGAWHIYTMSLDGAGVAQLTAGDSNNTAPQWSPDGKQMLFISDRSGGRELLLMNADGSNPRSVPGTTDALAAAWSPQGDRIALVKQDGPSTGALSIIRPDGALDRTLKTGMKYAGQPAWSPDGTRLAIDSDWDGDYMNEIYSFDLTVNYLSYDRLYDGGYWGNLIYREGWAGSYSPDGKAFMFTLLVYELVGNELVTNAAWLATVPAPTGIATETLFPGSVGLDFAPHWANSDKLPPVTWLTAPGPYVPLRTVRLSRGGYDPGGSGLKDRGYEVEWARDGGAWQPLAEGSWNQEWDFTPEVGGTYVFRLRGQDEAGNVEPWPTNPEGDAMIKFYTAEVDGRVVDMRGQGVPGATVTQAPAALNEGASDRTGAFQRYLAGPVIARATARAEHYGAPPPALLVVRDVNPNRTERGELRIALPDTVNWISGGGFDGAGLDPAWQAEGASHTTAEGEPHGGPGAAVLGAANEFAGQEVLQGDDPALAEAGGVAHVAAATVFNGTRAFMYNRRDASGHWLAAPLLLKTNDAPGAGGVTVVADPAGGAHLLYQFGEATGGGGFSDCYVAPGATECAMQPKLEGLAWGWNGHPTLAADAQGGLHALWNEYRDGSLRYAYRPGGGAWRYETVTQEGYTDSFALAVDAAGHAHALRTVSRDGGPVTAYYYSRAAGSWSAAERVSEGPQRGAHYLAVAADGTLHVVIDELGYFRAASLGRVSKAPGGAWTEGAPLPVAVTAASITVRAEGGTMRVAFQDGDRVKQYELAGDAWQLLEERAFGARLNALTLETGGGLAILDQAAWGAPVRYRHSVPAASAATYALTQTITVPAGSHAPTLAFFYRGDGWVRPGDLGVSVAGAPVTLHRIAGEWTQAWADLAPWAGQTVAVRFELKQAAGRLNTRARLDDVMAGQWLTPVIDAVTVEGGALRVTGANFTGAAISLGAGPLAVTEQRDTQIIAALPANFHAGRYTVTVTNAGGQRGLMPLAVGREVFLPVTR